MASRNRRIAVALLFTATGITSLGVAVANADVQGFTSTSQATATGRAADKFPVAATSVPAAAAAVVPAQAGIATQPPLVEPPQASQPAVSETKQPKPNTSRTSKAPKVEPSKKADPEPSATPTPTDPAAEGN